MGCLIKSVFLGIIVLFLLAIMMITKPFPPKSTPEKEAPTPGWEQVQSGVFTVISNWHINVLAGETSDDCDIAAASVAKRWAVEKYLEGIRTFVLKEVTKKAIEEVTDFLFPASWAEEALRGLIIRWIYDKAADFLAGQQEFRAGNLTLRVSEMGRGGRSLLSHLPGDLQFTDHFLVGYNREKGCVALLVIADCGGKDSRLRGLKPRAWEAEYEIDANGLPKNPRQSLQKKE